MKAWEKLLAALMEALQGVADTQTLQANGEMTINGRTDLYPVDWYWEFRASNGVVYKIVASLKNVEKTLQKNEMFSFASMVQDLSGSVMGVIFTQPVYEKQIHDIARDVGVLLYEMPEINDKPRLTPQISGFHLDLDEAWIAEEKRKAGLGEEKIPFSGQPEYMYLYDEENLCIDSIAGIVESYVKQRVGEPEKEHAIQHEFHPALYLRTEQEAVPRIKINGLSFRLRYQKTDAWNGASLIEKIVQAAMQRHS